MFFSFNWWWSLFVCYLCLTWLFATCTTVQNIKEAFPKEIRISLMTCYIESFATWMKISLHEDSPTKMTSWWLSDYYNLTLKVKGKKTCVLEYLFLEIFVYLYCESSKFKIYVTCILIYVVSQLQRNEVICCILLVNTIFNKIASSWKRVSIFFYYLYSSDLYLDLRWLSVVA